MANALEISFNLFEGMLQLVYPPYCLLCGVVGADVLCDDCLSTIATPVPNSMCLRCGQVILSPTCSKCNDFPPGLIRCRAVAVHEGSLADMIHQLKYRDKPMLARPLARLIVDFLKVREEIFNGLEFDAIVPVPLHWNRELRRGYNQSGRIAMYVGASLNLPVAQKLLGRTRATSQQVGMRRVGRLRNLEGAFRANPDQCRNKTFLLIDDVTTTGSTIRECARALLSAGASKVYGITLGLG